MATYRALPAFLSNVSRRFATPVAASVSAMTLIIAVVWIYMLAAGTNSVVANVVAVAGLLAAMFYILTALAMLAYYRRQIFATPRDFLTVGLLPLGAAIFLSWVVTRSLQLAPATQRLTILVIILTGVVFTLIARFGLRSVFFSAPRESYRKP